MTRVGAARPASAFEVALHMARTEQLSVAWRHGLRARMLGVVPDMSFGIAIFEVMYEWLDREGT